MQYKSQIVDFILYHNGDDGLTAFLHIKYSDDGGTSFTSNNGETVGEYIGQYTDHIEDDSDSPSSYNWTKFVGKDGYTPQKGVDYNDGEDGSPFTIKGTYQDETELNTYHPTGNIGEGYIIDGDLLVWNGSAWENVGRIKGDDGTDATIKSDTAPEDTSKMWLDTSEEPYILKYYDGSEWVRANDHSQEISDSKVMITEKFESDLVQTKKEINLSVSKLETRVSTTETSITSIQTSIKQTNDDISFVKETNQTIKSELDGKTSQKNLEEYIRFDGAKVEIGTNESPFKSVLTNEALEFHEKQSKVAWVSNKEFNVKKMVAQESFYIGPWSMVYEEGVGLVIKKAS